MPQQSGGEVATRVANGEADLGMTLIAEIVPDQRRARARAAAGAARQRHDLFGGRDGGEQRRGAALAFIAALTQPSARGAWEAADFKLP